MGVHRKMEELIHERSKNVTYVGGFEISLPP